jgi:hypothetical protein
MAEHWMQKVTSKMDKGAFSAKAKRAGMSTAAYASKVTKKGSHASAKTKKQATLAKTFAKAKH